MTDINDTIEQLKTQVAELQRKNAVQAGTLRETAEALGANLGAGLSSIVNAAKMLKANHAATVAEKDALQAKDNTRSDGLMALARLLDYGSVPPVDEIVKHVRALQQDRKTLETVSRNMGVAPYDVARISAIRRPRLRELEECASAACKYLGVGSLPELKGVLSRLTEAKNTPPPPAPYAPIVDVVNEYGAKAFRLAPDCSLETLLNRIRSNQDALRQSEQNNNTLERVLGEVTELCGVRPAGAIAYASDPGWSKRVVDHLKKDLEQSYKDQVDKLTVARDFAIRERDRVHAQLDDCYKENARCAERLEEQRKCLHDRIFPSTCTLVVCDGGFKIEVP